ncbi:MAG: hypothetical protein FWE38_03210 [Firmicutes bacterium]|nr:hypothetical protein [Bacillota bacterium]
MKKLSLQICLCVLLLVVVATSLVLLIIHLTRDEYIPDFPVPDRWFSYETIMVEFTEQAVMRAHERGNDPLFSPNEFPRFAFSRIERLVGFWFVFYLMEPGRENVLRAAAIMNVHRDVSMVELTGGGEGAGGPSQNPPPLP